MFRQISAMEIGGVGATPGILTATAGELVPKTGSVIEIAVDIIDWIKN